MDNGEIILYNAEDGSATIRLRAEGETVWLTQLEIANLTMLDCKEHPTNWRWRDAISELLGGRKFEPLFNIEKNG